MYKVCDNSRLSQRLNKRSVFRLLVTICSWKQFFLSMAYEVFLGFPQANEMVLWRNDYYEGFIIEPYTLRSIKFLEVILPPPTSLILTLWKLRQRCECSAQNHTVNGKFTSQVFKLLFIYLFIDFSFTHYFIYSIHICWTIVICQGLCYMLGHAHIRSCSVVSDSLQPCGL